MKKRIYLWSAMLFVIMLLNGCTNSNEEYWHPELMQNGKYGYVDDHERTVIEPMFEEADAFREGLAGVKIDGKWGYIDKTGSIVIAPRYEFFNQFSEGFAAVKTNGKWGFIDKTGNVVIEPIYDYAGYFHDGLAYVKIESKLHVIEKTGIIVGNIKEEDLGNLNKTDSIKQRILDSLSRR